MMRLPYGFRIVGTTATRRRLVDAAAAFAGYSSCDPKANLDREAYLSAFHFGGDFRNHFRATGSTRDFAGPCWAPFVWFDIDRPDNPDCAVADARRLVAVMLDRYTDIDDDALLIFFSGSKGYHIGLPLCWDAPPSPSFHHVARRFAEGLAQRAGVKIDTSIYDKVRAFRAPNSTHPGTGLRKRCLTLDELNGLTPDGIRQLAKAPMPFELRTPKKISPAVGTDWNDAVMAICRQTEANAERRRTALNGTPTLNRLTLAFLRDGAEFPDRHRLLFSAAANLAEFGCPSLLAHALLTEAGLDIGLPPTEVRRQIDCGLKHVGKQAEGKDNG